MDFTPPPPPPKKSGFKLVCNDNIVCGNLETENSQDYAQKPQRNCMFVNLASGFCKHQENQAAEQDANDQQIFVNSRPRLYV